MNPDKIPALLRRFELPLLLLVLPLLSAVLHARAFRQELIGVHAWRQTQTQSTILSYVEEDFNLFNPRKNDRGAGTGIFRMEFPLMQWLFAGVHKIIGPELWISRVLSFLLGLFTLWGMYVWAAHLFRDRLAGFIGAWMLCFSPAFFYYTVNPLPDNLALCFGIWGLVFTFRWDQTGKWIHFLVACVFLSLSTLIKLPFVLLFAPGIGLMVMEFRRNRQIKPLVEKLAAGLLLLMPPALWYGNVISGWHGNDVVWGMLGNQSPWRRLLGYCWDNLISTLPETLLNYAAVPLFLAGIFFSYQTKAFRNRIFHALGAGILALLAYYLFELNQIANVHDYYLFPFLPFLFLTVVYGGWKLLGHRRKVYQGLVVLLLLLAPLAAHLRMQSRWNPDRPGFNADLYNNRQELREAVPDTALCVVGNDVSHFIYFYYLHKKGWAFDADRLSPESLQNMIHDGAKFLYSDTRNIDENAGFQPFLDSLILERGTMRLYKLKNRAGK